MANQKNILGKVEQLINRSLLLTTAQKSAWKQKIPSLSETVLKRLELLLKKSNEELFNRVGEILQKDAKGVHIIKLQDMTNRVNRESLQLTENTERDSESLDVLLEELKQI